MLFLLVFSFSFNFLLVYSFGPHHVPSQFFYKYPNEPVNSPNLTIAAVFPLETDEPVLNLENAANLMTILCKVEKYNKNNGMFPVKGKFNVLVFPLNSVPRFGQWSLMQQTIAQNLYYTNKTQRSLGVLQDTPIGVIIKADTLRELANSLPPLSGFSLPSINFAQADFAFESDNLPVVETPYLKNPAGLVINRANNSLLSDNIFKTLLHFNWTLIAAIFSTDITGFVGQSNFQNVAAAYQSSVTFSCNAVLDSINTASYQTDIDHISSCIVSSNVVRAVIIWMNPEEAVFATEQIQKKTGMNDLIFIYPGMTDSLALTKVPVSSMYFSPSLDSNPNDPVFACSRLTREKMIKALGQDIIDRVTKKFGKCIISNPSLPPCKEVRTDDDEDTQCSCLSDKIYFSSYASDSIDMLMKAIYNIQSNCSLMNSCAQESYSGYQQDFCKIDSITGRDLSIAIRCSTIFAQSGFISFDNSSVVRKNMPMNLFQVQDNSRVIKIATFSVFKDSFYNNDYFVYGVIPISKIEVDDQTLANSGIVEVFFALNVVLFILTVSLVIYVFVYRNHRVIRNSSVAACYTILLGLILMELAVVFMCISISRFTCIMIDVLLILGISLIIAILMAKTYRIYRIFQNPSAEPIRITDVHLLIFTGLICAISMILFVLYSVLGQGLRPISMTADSNPLYVYSICEVPDSTIQVTFLIIFYAYFVSLFAITGILAFMTRKTMIDFNESWDLGCLVYSWLGVTLIYAPIYYVQGSSTNSNETRYTIRFIAIALLILLTIIILFGRKIKLIYRSNKSR